MSISLKMKNYLNLFIVLVCIHFCSGSKEGSENDCYGHICDNKDTYYDNDRDIVRPCSVHDLNCISQFLAHNSHCSERHGPVPDPLHLDRSTLPLPNANLTMVLNNIQVKGLDGGKITEFYINKKTDNLVIAVEVCGLTVYSKNTQSKYHRKGREPLVLEDSTIITYRKVTFTITIPNLKDLKLSRAEVYTFLDDSEPPYKIGPKLIPYKDPQAIKAYAELINNVPTSVAEAFVFQGPFFMAIYVQHNLCDFGLKLESY